MKTIIYYAILALMVFAAQANAQSVLFDFDSAPLHSPLPISLTSGDVTAFFSATGQGYSIQQANTAIVTPAGFSGYCIYPNSFFPADLLVDFSRTVVNFSILCATGESANDSAARMRVTAYMNGVEVGTNTTTATAGPPFTLPSATLSISPGQGFNRVIVHYDAVPPRGTDYTPTFMADNMTVTPAAVKAPGDFEASGRNNIAVYRPASGSWYLLSNTTPGSFTGIQWGSPGDLVVHGDYDGDSKTDYAVWRPADGSWFVVPSNSPPGTYTATQWGISTDKPVPADYDGDGKTDYAVWRPANGTWYVSLSTAPGTYLATQWGVSTDIPVPADYDGDGKADIAVWRPGSGSWLALPSNSGGNYTAIQWGVQGDIPVPGDYDGDGKADIGIWRPSVGIWYVLPSNSAPGSYTAQQCGLSTDTPVAGDYDGDGKTDVAVWRVSSGMWYIMTSASPGNYTMTQWGVAGDVPLSPLTRILGSLVP